MDYKLLKTFKQFLTEGGENSERQETLFVNSINELVNKNKNSITLIAGDVTIKDIVKALKYKGRSIAGTEPYTDVVLINSKGTEYNLSLKGDSAPSLGGGGLKGIELISKGLGKKYINDIHDYLTNTLKLKDGDKVPDIYGQIPEKIKNILIVGNEEMGGPIHFMYIGNMNIKLKIENDILTFENGKLIPSKEYSETHNLFFRYRARREDQRFDSTNKDKDGNFKIYGISPSKKDSNGRLVITDKVPNNAKVINI